MTEEDLYALYQLHLVDARIVEIKAAAASFDPTKELRQQAEALKAQTTKAKATLDGLRGDHKDLELRFKTVFDRLNKQMEAMMGGKITNPREIEALERDIEDLRERADAAEQQRVAVQAQIAPAEEKFNELDEKFQAKKRVYTVAYQKAVREREEMQAEYKDLVAKHGPLQAKVPPGLLTQYDAIRHKYGGIGMGVIRDGKVCGACNTMIPAKTVEAVKEGKLVTCESCHRILFNLLPSA
ncbi:MAG: hypothetical protein JNJ45_08045 [Chthonomonas sp.]|nr:hypothetical protein [Chthonomonas sp.]